MTKPEILKARIKTVFGAFKNAPKNKKDKTSWNFSIILNFPSTDILLEWMCLINNRLLYSISTCVTFSLLPLCHQTKLLYIFIKDSVWHIVIYTWKLVMLHIITVNIYIFCDLSFVHDFVCCPPRPEPFKIRHVHSMCVAAAYARASFKVQQGSFLGVHRPLAPHRHVIPHLFPKPGRRRKV